MTGALLAAQWLKIASGVAQLAFALWLGARGRRSAALLAFAISFGANGIAYALFNTSPPGQRTSESLAVQGRAVFNWIAVVAMILFVIAWLKNARRGGGPALVGTAVALATVTGTVIAAQAHRLGLLEFGGIAIYPATALALGVLPVLFRAGPPIPRAELAFVAAALAINSVDHLGAELVRPGPNPEAAVTLQLCAMAVVLALWLRNALGADPVDRRRALMVVACLVAPFVAAILVRVAAGSYAGVQRSGLIGVGRLAATGVLAYGMATRRAFSPAVVA